MTTEASGLAGYKVALFEESVNGTEAGEHGGFGYFSRVSAFDQPYLPAPSAGEWRLGSWATVHSLGGGVAVGANTNAAYAFGPGDVGALVGATTLTPNRHLVTPIEAPSRSNGASRSLLRLCNPSTGSAILEAYHSFDADPVDFIADSSPTATTFEAATGLLAVDVTQDALEDILVLHAGNVISLVPAAAGNFTFDAEYAAATLTEAVSCTQLVAGSVTTDGATDVAVVEADARQVHILVNSADALPTFASSAVVEFPEEIHELHVFLQDFDQDGDADLFALGTESGTVYHATNGDADTGATWSTPQALLTGVTGNVLAVGDVNGDTFPDVVVQLAVLGNVVYYAGNGDGTLATAPVGVISPFEGTELRTVQDMDGDAEADITVSKDGTLVSVTCESDGSCSMGSLLMVEPTASETGDMAFVDVNNDGLSDVVVNNYATLRYQLNPHGEPFGEDSLDTVYDMNASGPFTSLLDSSFFLETPENGSSFGWEMLSPQGSTLRVLKPAEALPSRDLVAATVTTTEGGYLSRDTMDVGDINGDGIDDVAFSVATETFFAIKLAGASGMDTTGREDMPTTEVCGAPGVPTVYRIRLGDIDADGDTDAMVSYNCLGAGGSIAQLINPGGAAGLMGAEDIVPVHTMYDDYSVLSSRFELADVDGDGDLDMVTVTETSVLLFENCGANRGVDTFAAPQRVEGNFGEVFSLESAHVADVDHDGNDDVVFATNQDVFVLQGASLSGVEELPPISFEAPVVASYGKAMDIGNMSIRMDVDSDGIMDFVVGYTNVGQRDRLDWYKGVDDLGYNLDPEPRRLFDCPETWSGDLLSVDAIDLDSNGNVDLLLMSEDSLGVRLSLVENLGEGHMAETHVDITDALNATSLNRNHYHFSDINGDGFVDVAYVVGASQPTTDRVYVAEMTSPLGTISEVYSVDDALVSADHTVEVVAVADVDGGDGFPEVLLLQTSASSEDPVLFMLLNAAGELGIPQELYTDPDLVTTLTAFLVDASGSLFAARGSDILYFENSGASLAEPIVAWDEYEGYDIFHSGGSGPGELPALLFPTDEHDLEDATYMRLSKSQDGNWAANSFAELFGYYDVSSDSTHLQYRPQTPWIDKEHASVVVVCELNAPVCAARPMTSDFNAAEELFDFSEGSLHLDDLDMDGRMDILATSFRAGSVLELRQQSGDSLTFDEVVMLYDPYTVSAMYAEFEGRRDLLQSFRYGTYRSPSEELWRLAMSEYGFYDPFFEPAEIAGEDGANFNGNSLFTAHMDDDDVLDIVSGGREGLFLHRYISETGFDTDDSFWFLGQVRALAPIDFDADGDTDIVAVSGGDAVFVERSLDTSNNTVLVVHRPVPLPFLDNEAFAKIVAMDMNGDGYEDLVMLGDMVAGVTEYAGGAVSIGWHPGASLRQEWTFTVVHQDLGTIRDIAVGDVDGNGYPDIAVAISGAQHSFDEVLAMLPAYNRVLLLRNREGHFGCADVVATDVTAFNVAIGQVDGLGHADVVSMDARGVVRVHLTTPPDVDSTTTSTTNDGGNTSGDGTATDATSQEVTSSGLATPTPSTPGDAGAADRGSSSVESEESSLGGGAIAGIVIGVIVAIVIAVGVGVAVSRQSSGSAGAGSVSPAAEAETKGDAEMGTMEGSSTLEKE